MNPGDLRDPLIIHVQSDSTSEDAFGQKRVVWAPMAGDLGWDWGKVDEITSVTYPIAQHWVEKASHIIRMRWRQDLALQVVKYRIIHDGRTFDLLGSTARDNVRREIIVAAVEIKNPKE
jgi:hypothetical protein